MLFEQILHLVRKIFHVRTDLDQKLFMGHNFNIICFAYKRTELTFKSQNLSVRMDALFHKLKNHGHFNAHEYDDESNDAEHCYFRCAPALAYTDTEI